MRLVRIASVMLAFVVSLAVVSVVMGQDVPDKLEFDQPASAPAQDQFILGRIRLSLTERGECELVLDTRTDPATQPASRPATQPSTAIAGLGGAIVTKTGKVYRVTHDFSTIPNVTDLGMSNAAPIEGTVEDGVLVLTAAKRENGASSATFAYPRTLRLPLSIEVNVVDGTRHFQISLHTQDNTLLLVNCESDDVSAPVAQAAWRKGEKWEDLSTLRGKAGGTATSLFTFPAGVTNLKGQMRVRFGSLGNNPLRIRKIDVTGVIVPRWVAGFDFQNGKVVVKSLWDGPAMKAGVKPGDILVSLDGQPVKDLQGAMRRLASYNLGDPVVWTVSRDGKIAKVRIIAE